MVFEIAMVEELGSILKLKDKCYPLIAPKDSTGPFLIYRKMSLDYVKTLSGFNGKCTGEYEFALISRTYEELQELTNDVIEKIKSLLGRYIGTSVLLIEAVDIYHKGDVYELNSEFYRANLVMKVKY